MSSVQRGESDEQALEKLRSIVSALTALGLIATKAQSKFKGGRRPPHMPTRPGLQFLPVCSCSQGSELRRQIQESRTNSCQILNGKVIRHSPEVGRQSINRKSIGTPKWKSRPSLPQSETIIADLTKTQIGRLCTKFNRKKVWSTSKALSV